MNAIPGIADGALPPGVADWLAQAVASYPNTERAEFLLCTAQALAPECLPVYFALYKFYFYKKRLEQAEQAALAGMSNAARLGGFEPEWHKLTPRSADWQGGTGAAHFYLFTLKALAFIHLRTNRAASCQAMLDKLAEIDPGDQVGACVIRDFAAGAQS